MQSQAATVREYLNEIPIERRSAVEAVRQLFLKNLDPEFEEGMQYGMIGYFVPHKVFPAGYHCNPKQPLPFAAIASQKNFMAVYLMCLYMRDEDGAAFRKAWAATGKKLDMGKCCIRFKKLDDLALEVIGAKLRSTTAREFIRYYEQSRADHATERATKKSARNAPKTSAKKSG